MMALWRKYSDEVARSGMGRSDMRQRVLDLLDKQGRLGVLPPIERFEAIGLFASSRRQQSARDATRTRT